MSGQRTWSPSRPFALLGRNGVLTPAEAGWHVELCIHSPVLRLGLAYTAHVAGSGERKNIAQELAASHRERRRQGEESPRRDCRSVLFCTFDAGSHSAGRGGYFSGQLTRGRRVPPGGRDGARGTILGPITAIRFTACRLRLGLPFGLRNLGGLKDSRSQFLKVLASLGAFVVFVFHLPCVVLPFNSEGLVCLCGLISSKPSENSLRILKQTSLPYGRRSRRVPPPYATNT